MSPLEKIIWNELKKCGVISFARFMELALYCPVYGFYEQEPDIIGKGGHYYTSISTGSLFGELLAVQFADWLRVLPQNISLQLVEAGAHDGRLAADILGWLAVCEPKLLERIEYWLIEPSARRREWQRKTLGRFSDRVRWVDTLDAYSGRVVGIIFSNEFLDSLPVHRFSWDAQSREWVELGVTYSEGRFIWTKIQNRGCNLRLPVQLPTELLEVLPDGYTIETCPAAETWWSSAARALAAGKLITIDYGFDMQELFNPARTKGTVRAYWRHQLMDDVLARPGQQDITAHVNFSALQTVGEAAGLTTDGLFTQGQFLTQIVERALRVGMSWCNWSDAQKRQFKTLVHPAHLGNLFRVFVQSRGS